MSQHDQPQGSDSPRPAPPSRAVPEFAPPPRPEDRAPEYVELDFGEEEEKGRGFGARLGIKRRERAPEAELPPRVADPFGSAPESARSEREPAPPEVSEVSEVPEVSEVSEVSEVPEVPAAPEAPEAPEAVSMRAPAQFTSSEEENVLVGDLDLPVEPELPPHGEDPFADSADSAVPRAAGRVAPPTIIDATATEDERTGRAWRRQTATPDVVDEPEPEEKKEKKEGRMRLGRRGKEAAPAAEATAPAAVAFCPLHDVPLSAPLLFNENTGARYPVGTTHAVCIGVLPAPAPVADREPLYEPEVYEHTRPEKKKREKKEKVKKVKKVKPAKEARPSWRERRAQAGARQREDAQEGLLEGLLAEEEQQPSRSERRQQARLRKQLDASARREAKEAAKADREGQVVAPFEEPEAHEAMPIETLGEATWAPVEEPKAEKADKKRKKRPKEPKEKKAKPARPKRERRSLLSLLGIKKAAREDVALDAPSPWDDQAVPTFTPPLVESVSEEPPRQSFPPLVIDAVADEPPLPHMRRPELTLPPAADPFEPEDSPLVIDASRPDAEIARAQRRFGRRKTSRAPEGTSAAGQAWRQRILAPDARPFLLLLVAAFLLLSVMWVLAVRGDDSARALSSEGQTSPGVPAPAGEVEVPDVVGQTVEEARLVASAASLETAVKQTQSDRPQGEIVSQDPEAGGSVAAGSVLTVTVSAGQGKVPDVTGLDVEVAQGRIEGAGFEVERRARIDRARIGKVIEQQPRAGARAGMGTVVVVFFGRAPAAAPLPSLVGKTQSQARLALADKGYTVRIRYQYAPAASGNVIRSDPPAGQKLAQGDRVTLVVSLGPRTTSTTPQRPQAPGTVDTVAAKENGEIAFVVAPGGKGEIYLAEADGSSRDNLSDHPGDDRNPTFAPTGLSFAFQSDRAGNHDIYSRPIVGQGLRRLTTAVNDEREPAWSPEGRRIAYVSKEGEFYALYTMATDGSGKTKLLGGQRSWRNPSWSPDGKRLLVAGGNADDYNIFVVSAAGGNPRQVAGSDDYDIDPVFSPDGRRAVFSSNRDGDYDLYSVALQGGAATRLTGAAGDDMSPSYSPDGQRILFQSDRAGQVAVYHMPATGGSARRVAPGQTPAWQPSF